MKRTHITVVSFGLAALIGCSADSGTPSGSERAESAGGPGVHSGAPVHRREYLSPVYTVDQIFKSMEGPMAKDTIRVVEGSPEDEPELVWIVRYQATVTDPDGSLLSEEFMCHANIDAPPSYREQFGTGLRVMGDRLAVLSQGQLAIEMPQGFGIPWVSNEPLDISTQVLNHNIVGETLRVRQRVFIDYVKDSDLEKPLKPLIQNGASGLSLVEGNSGYYGLPKRAVDEDRHGPGCALAPTATDEHLLEDGLGRRFSAHWVVEPGRHEYHTLVTGMLMLPYDTTIHMVAAHLHPFAETLELRDLTTGKTVLSVEATQAGEGKIGLAKVEDIKSVEGIPIFKGHEYELVSVYENTSGVQQDSMASMMLYLHAKDMKPRKAMRQLLRSRGAADPR